MALDYNFAGNINRDNAMSAVADVMNGKNKDILSVSMEMGGKQIAKVNGEGYAIDRIEAAEVKNILDQAGGATAVLDEATQQAVCSLLGIDKSSIATENGKSLLTLNVEDITNASSGNIGDASTLKLSLSFIDKDTGKHCSIGAELNADGGVTAFSPLQSEPATKATKDKYPTISLHKVDTTGLLESWGIDGEELSPGDLFFVSQQLQMIKDLIGTVHTTGKTQGDVMREVTQKFSQG